MQWKNPPTHSQIQREVQKHLKSEPIGRQQQYHLRRRDSTDQYEVDTVETKILEPRHLLPVAQLVRMCNQHGPEGHGEMQLLMNLSVITQDGTEYHLKALVDTGAQTNCIRHNAMPRHHCEQAKAPITLITVSGENLPGGKHEV